MEVSKKHLKCWRVRIIECYIYGIFVSSVCFSIFLAANYFAHFLLIEKLLPIIKNSNKPKILYTNSFYHYSVDGQELIGQGDDGTQPPSAIYPYKCPTLMYRDQWIYASSKLSMLLHSRHLKRRNPNIDIVSADPGWTATNLNGPTGSLLHDPMQWLGFPVEGWGLVSLLSALFTDTTKDDDGVDLDYWSNSKASLLFPATFNTGIIPKWMDKYLMMRDHVVCVWGFVLGYTQRFVYGAFPSEASKESYNVTLQESLFIWSQVAVSEWL
jgi:hypothetical protein